MRASRRQSAVLGGLALIAVVAVAAIVAVDIGRGLVRTPGQAACSAIGNVSVGDLTQVSWDNGMTLTGAVWMTVLTDGVTHAAEAERPRIAAALRSDQEGYGDFIHALPAEVRPAAERLHALALEPDLAAQRAKDPEVEADAIAIRRYALSECGFV